MESNKREIIFAYKQIKEELESKNMIGVKIKNKKNIISASDWCSRSMETGFISGGVKTTNWQDVVTLFSDGIDIWFYFDNEADALKFKFEGF